MYSEFQKGMLNVAQCSESITLFQGMSNLKHCTNRLEIIIILYDVLSLNNKRLWRELNFAGRSTFTFWPL